MTAEEARATAAKEGLHAALEKLEVVAVPHVAVAVDVLDAKLVDVEDVSLLLGEGVPLLDNKRCVRLYFLWQALVKVVQVRHDSLSEPASQDQGRGLGRDERSLSRRRDDGR